MEKTKEQLDYEKALQEKPPVEITELLAQPGEVIFKQLSDEDKFQLLTRYFNDNNTMQRSLVALISQMYLVIRAIAEKEGIDVKAYLREVEKKAIAESDKAVKEELDKVKN